MSVHKLNDQGHFILGIQGCINIGRSMLFITLIVMEENTINRGQKFFDELPAIFMTEIMNKLELDEYFLNLIDNIYVKEPITKHVTIKH